MAAARSYKEERDEEEKENRRKATLADQVLKIMDQEVIEDVIEDPRKKLIADAENNYRHILSVSLKRDVNGMIINDPENNSIIAKADRDLDAARLRIIGNRELKEKPHSIPNITKINLFLVHKDDKLGHYVLDSKLVQEGRMGRWENYRMYLPKTLEVASNDFVIRIQTFPIFKGQIKNAFAALIPEGKSVVEKGNVSDDDCFFFLKVSDLCTIDFIRQKLPNIDAFDYLINLVPDLKNNRWPQDTFQLIIPDAKDTLMTELQKLKIPSSAVEGKPHVISIKRDDIERKFAQDRMGASVILFNLFCNLSCSNPKIWASRDSEIIFSFRLSGESHRLPVFTHKRFHDEGENPLISKLKEAKCTLKIDYESKNECEYRIITVQDLAMLIKSNEKPNELRQNITLLVQNSLFGARNSEPEASHHPLAELIMGYVGYEAKELLDSNTRDERVMIQWGKAKEYFATVRDLAEKERPAGPRAGP